MTQELKKHFRIKRAKSQFHFHQSMVQERQIFQKEIGKVMLTSLKVSLKTYGIKKCQIFKK